MQISDCDVKCCRVYVFKVSATVLAYTLHVFTSSVSASVFSTVSPRVSTSSSAFTSNSISPNVSDLSSVSVHYVSCTPVLLETEPAFQPVP